MPSLKLQVFDTFNFQEWGNTIEIAIYLSIAYDFVIRKKHKWSYREICTSMKLPPDSVTMPVLFQRSPITFVKFSGGRDLKYWPFIHLAISVSTCWGDEQKKPNKVKENIKTAVLLKRSQLTKPELPTKADNHSSMYKYQEP